MLFACRPAAAWHLCTLFPCSVHTAHAEFQEGCRLKLARLRFDRFFPGDFVVVSGMADATHDLLRRSRRGAAGRRFGACGHWVSVSVLGAWACLCRNPRFAAGPLSLSDEPLGTCGVSVCTGLWLNDRTAPGPDVRLASHAECPVADVRLSLAPVSQRLASYCRLCACTCPSLIERSRA